MRYALALALMLCATPATAQQAAEAAAERLGIRLPKGSDMRINSAELEAERGDDGTERVVFQREVRVVQADLQIDCDWLEAIYLQGAKGQADRITARGSVTLRQAEIEARCTDAVFDNAGQTLLCTASKGKAELRRAKDIIRADRIHFDLKSGRFRASGGVEVEMRSNGDAE